MKKLFSLFVFGLLFFICLTTRVLAHNEDAVSFTKIDNKSTLPYPIPTISTDTVVLPQDTAPATYEVGQLMTFSIDREKLPVPIDLKQKSQILWQFGDGGTAVGFTVAHHYLKQGSYIVHVGLSANQVGEFETIFMNVFAKKNDQPFAIQMLVDDMEGSQSVTQPLTISPDQPLRFRTQILSATDSSEIQEIFWDFGDGQSATGASVVHAYHTTDKLYFPMVRAKNKNGFFADAYAVLGGKTIIGGNVPASQPTLFPQSARWAFFVVIAVAITVFIAFLLVIQLRQKQNR
jgi:hypothetical protein